VHADQGNVECLKTKEALAAGTAAELAERLIAAQHELEVAVSYGKAFQIAIQTKQSQGLHEDLAELLSLAEQARNRIHQFEWTVSHAQDAVQAASETHLSSKAALGEALATSKCVNDMLKATKQVTDAVSFSYCQKAKVQALQRTLRQADAHINDLIFKRAQLVTKLQVFAFVFS
jgi:hypothetical protein